MIQFNKFGVTGLLHFNEGFLPSHTIEFPFQKFQYIWKK